MTDLLNVVVSKAPTSSSEIPGKVRKLNSKLLQVEKSFNPPDSSQPKTYSRKALEKRPEPMPTNLAYDSQLCQKGDSERFRGTRLLSPQVWLGEKCTRASHALPSASVPKSNALKPPCLLHWGGRNSQTGESQTRRAATATELRFAAISTNRSYV